MNLEALTKLSDLEIASWVRANTNEFTLIKDEDLSVIIQTREYWEQNAIELANEVATLLDVDIGEPASNNCPVQNAIEAVYQSRIRIQKIKDIKNSIGDILDSQGQ